MREVDKLYDSISNIDQRFIEEARSEAPVRTATRRKWVAAACICIAAAGIFAAARPGKNADAPAPDPGGAVEREPEPGEYPPVSIEPGFTLDEPEEPGEPEGGNYFPVVFNEVDAIPAGTEAMISLAAEDLCPMSAEESLRYFGVSLPEDGIVPGCGFELTGGGCFGGGHGVYMSEDRGVYYDLNSYVFTNGGKSVTLTLRTVFKNMIPSPEQVKNGPEEIKFIDVHGWDLALFSCADDSGTRCVYAEFAWNGVVFTLTASGLERNELGLALTSVLPERECAPDTHTAAGVVTYVDNRREDYFDGVRHHYTESRDYITADFGGTPMTVWLPGEAGGFDVGDSVTVTYKGDPATAFNLWPGQILGVE